MTKKMKIRDSYFFLGGDKTTHTFNSIEIVNKNGDALFAISMTDDGGIEVRASGFTGDDAGGVLTEHIYIMPRASNSIGVYRVRKHG